MSEGDLGFVGSVVLWLIIPPLIAKFLLKQYHSFGYNRGTQPKEDSFVYKRQYQKCLTMVVCGYFLYCLANSYLSLPQTLYDLLGVHRQDIDAKLKTQFRQLVVTLHPDKSPHANPETFLRVKSAYEILENPVTRSAYDTYGPSVVSSVQKSSSKSNTKPSIQDYFSQAFMEWVGFYVGTGAMFLLIIAFSSKDGIFWRGLGLLVVSCLDLHALMRPEAFGTPIKTGNSMLGIPVRLWNSIPTFQKIFLLRQIYIYGSMALGQIFSLLQPPNPQVAINRLIGRVAALVGDSLRKESDYQLAISLEPVAKDDIMRNQLKRKMGKMAAEIKLFEKIVEEKGTKK